MVHIIVEPAICAHVLATSETRGHLPDLLERFSYNPSQAMHKQRKKGAGDKRSKKPRRGRNNVASAPVHTEINRGLTTSTTACHADISYQRPVPFSEIFHDNNQFHLIFTRDVNKKKGGIRLCESCKVEMQNKSVPPFDMAISHKERYRYPVRDDRGTVLRYTATIIKLATRYYCVDI